jgi:hypothetical protein
MAIGRRVPRASKERLVASKKMSQSAITKSFTRGRIVMYNPKKFMHNVSLMRSGRWRAHFLENLRRLSTRRCVP